jgi:hypothetical protein
MIDEHAPLISEIRALRPRRAHERIEPAPDAAPGAPALALYLLGLASVSLVSFALTFWAAAR